MHSHLYADEWVADSVGRYELGVYLANGVTTARMMIGTPLHQTLRKAIEAGGIAGPQLWIASPEFSGQKQLHGRLVTTPDEARRAVREVADSGFDFIKVTTDITLPVYDAIVSEAALRHIRVVGHVDPRVGVAHALQSGQQIEHLDNYMESVLADSAPSRNSVSDVGAYRVANWATLDYVDNAKVEAIAGATARAGGYVTPTLAFFRLWFATPTTDEAFRARPDYAQIPPAMRDLYARSHNALWRNPPSEARRAHYIAVRNRMVRAIIDSGGHIMAGSDGPGGLMGYGWTLHRELEMLVDAGLSPWQALQAATTVPAAFLHAEREWGQIAPGQRADLVVLDADPLADIRNTTQIRSVVVGGRWFERPALDSMIREAGTRLNPQPTDGAALLRQMHDRYQGKWYKTMTFVQRTTFPGRPDQTWYETAEMPGKLRIDISPVDSGNTILFVGDSTIRFRRGQRVGARAEENVVGILLADVYGLPADESVRRMRGAGFDLSRLSSGNWQGRPVWIVGAAVGDSTTPQFWVDQERLYTVRLIEKPPGESAVDTRISGHTPAGQGWIEREIHASRDGVEIQGEYYSNIKLNPVLDPTTWNTTIWARPTWIP
ncbi:MAG: amidohydrolase family protein, partial [Gemmatimonadales bacterium]